MKRNSGITLIALIITVVIMLILAGVSISLLTDGGGLFDKTKKAAKEYKKESLIEVVKNAELELKIDTIIDESIDFNITNLIEKVKEISEINDRDYIIIVNEEEQSAIIIDKATGIIIEIWIKENDNVIIEDSIVDDITNITKPIIELSLDSEEETYSETVKIIVTVKEETNGITKIQFPDNSEKTYSSEKTVTEEYIVNKNGTYKFTAEGGNGRTASKSINVEGVTPFNDENKTYDGQSIGAFDNPIIPKGFRPINENDAIWGTEDGYQKGLVIQDKNGNEFVWVPVDGTIITFAKYNWGKNEGTYSTYTETVPTVIITSVNKNGGFYIGRYEAGQSGTTVLSKKGATVWNKINWSTANTIAAGMYTSSDTNYGVISTLIYGTQWDTALKFVGAYGGDTAYVTDSTGKGNYSGTNGGDTTTATPSTCGLLEAFRQKNIYDMAGNLYEWTAEQYDIYRVHRGGGYNYSGLDGPVSYRSYLSATHNGTGVGFRVALYIK